MIRQRHLQTTLLFLIGDLVATALAFFAAWTLRFEVAIVPLVKDIPEFRWYLPLLPIMLLMWPVVFYFHGLYQIRRGHSRVEEFFTLVSASTLAILMLAGATAFYRPLTEPDGQDFFSYSRVFLLLLLASSVVFATLSRMVLRGVLQALRARGHNLRRILVLGAGNVGREITQKILDHRGLGFEVVGFLDDDPGLVEKSFFGVPVLGPIQSLKEVLAAQPVDQLMIALPLDAHRKILTILEMVETECLEVRLVPDVLQYATLRAGLEDLDGTPVINLSQVPLMGWRSFAKRGMDLAIAALGILLLSPLLPFVALAIWLEDRGPIFYRQERMGLDGRPFMLVKFRSMRVNAESSSGPVWAVRDDPRRTHFGSLLRRTSLDELPQLWNVFKGEMSLVGPRPERPTFVDEFKYRIPNYMLRHRVKAGITGWAQVHGWRGNTSVRKRLQYDLYYIENWSLKLDLKILWMTLRLGWVHNNAY